MDPAFWHRRWEADRIGFHQRDISLHLQRFWRHTDAAPGSTVFVPLCGKSHDMRWLADQGLPVLGIEISPVAVQAFFAEQGWQPRRTRQGCFECWQSGNVKILLGDFFDLGVTDLQGVGAVYDRASLIALPPAMREDYVRHLLTVCPPGINMLLVTLEYDQADMNGPPFSVREHEVRSLYAATCEVELVYSHDALPEAPHFRDKGLRALMEHVYLLRLPGRGAEPCQ